VRKLPVSRLDPHLMAEQLKACTGIQVKDRSAINLKTWVQTLLNMASREYFESNKKVQAALNFTKRYVTQWQLPFQSFPLISHSIIPHLFFTFNLRTAAFKAYCAIWVKRSNFRHQASPRV